MNMFKSRRKAKDFDGLETLAGGQPTPPTHKAVRGLKRKNKNIQEEQKPVFDLSTALPDSDDFRTSLLMPKLSARFSMLREQDDPNTKVGKASDDSVLFPKRASRLNLFGHYPLTDITEVESIYSTFRPPFADRDRSSSVGDGYESDNGSVMSRSRPGEGNTLFGGRQKQFKMPTSATRAFSETGHPAAGKHTYGSDIPQLQFQQYKSPEKDALSSPIEVRDSVPVTEEGDNSEIASPATAFSRHRGTQSSTNSNTGRSSTAATSVASESMAFRSSGADNVVSKSHDSVLPTPENLASISIPKTREEAVPNRFFSQSRSVTGDKAYRPTPVYGTSLRNASSPPVVALDQPLDFGFNTEVRSVSIPNQSQAESPVPAADDVLADSVQPNDRGKATALGLFNKPAREFDEHQFNQRQVQMHEEHVSTMSNGSRSTSRASNDAARARQNSLQTVASPLNTSDEQSSAPQVPPIPSTSASPIPDSNRASKASEHSVVTRPRSRSAASATAVANVRARVESLIRKQNIELAAFEAGKLPGLHSSENKENLIGAFFDNDEDEESDFDESSHVESGRITSSRVNSVQIDESHIHPAFRNSYRVSDIPSRKSNHSNFSRTRSVVADEQRESSKLPVPVIEAEQGEVGLSGLIRAHLRQNSDKSSFIFRPESEIGLQTTEQSPAPSIVSTPNPADSIPCKPFELDLNQNLTVPQISEEPPTPTTAMSQMAQHFLSQAMAIKDAAEKERTENSANDFLSKPWQDDLEPKHQRSESSETTKERREFDEKLAQRRMKIQQGLKSVTERERSQSPANVSRVQPVGFHAFVQQRAATDPQPKALKVLGLQNRPGTGGVLEDDRERHAASRNGTRSPLPEHGFNNIKQTATYARFTESTPDRRYPPRSATPQGSRPGRRERADSHTGERSRSRPRKDANPPMPHALGTFHNWNQPSPSPKDDLHSPDLILGAKNIHRNRHYPPDLHIGPTTQASFKPSPISPESSHESPIDGVRPSQATYNNGRTTPSNGRSTPNAFNRKRSVTKTMISEPTFVSSTSSVPLVHLPDAQQNPALAMPAVPVMHPRRRGNTINDEPVFPSKFPRSPLEPVPASPVIADFGSDVMGRKSPSPRKLRKATSEGGSMAAKARQQALAGELAEEKTRSPAMPVFPNRSTPAVDSRADGAMF